VDGDITTEFEYIETNYAPLSKENLDVSLTLEMQKTCRLGVLMVKSIMDSVKCLREGVKNILTVRKNGSRESRCLIALKGVL